MAASRPRVILSAAVSIDGKIATRTGDSRLSSEDDIARLHELRGRTDAILVGKNTVLCDDPMLTVRHARGPNPVRIILDSNGEISEDYRVLKTAAYVPTILAVSESVDAARLEELMSRTEVIVAGRDSVDIRLLLERLAGRGIKTVLVEGGGTVNWEFVRLGLFDEVVVTISPYLLGGEDAISLVRGRGFAAVADSPEMHLKSARQLGDHVVLHYVRK